jgi:homoserine dehydrogenase
MQIGIGIIGVGTVGSGTVDILLEKKAYYQELYGLDFNITMVCARTDEELAPFRALGLTGSTQVQDIMTNPAISIVVELAGGYELPKSWIEQALTAGKHVVTANKALIAKYGAQLFPLAAKNKRHFLFEAAVGGGIPIIRSLQEALTGNSVNSIKCIINGTCNYILTEMSQKGSAFASVLAEAQSLGYAEADPTFDVDGIDSAHKLAILATLGSKQYVDFNKIHIEGIRRINETDIAFAREMGFVIKLLGVFSKVEGKTDARVHPALLPGDHLLASVNGVLNAVYLETDHLGPTLQTGAGAGKYPTASAVVADIVAIGRQGVKGGMSPIPMDFFSEGNPADLLPIEETSSAFYLRFTTRDETGVLASITKILSQQGISVESMIQKGHQKKDRVVIVMVTQVCKEGLMRQALEQINTLNFMVQPAAMIRFI